MGLSKAQLLGAANEYARELGLPPVSESVLEGWIFSGFIPGAVARGVRRGTNPKWTYPDQTLEKVKLILALKSIGAARSSQTVVCLSLFGTEFSHKRVADALKSELRRVVKRQERGPPWFESPLEDLPRLSEVERTRRLKQMPGLDDDLAVFALPQITYHAIGLQAYWGAERPGSISSTAFSALFAPADGVDGPPDILSMMLEIGGAIGPPEESAIEGYNVFDRITPADLKQARMLFLTCAIVLVLVGMALGALPSLKESKISVAYSKAATSFLSAEWMVLTTAMFAISAFNGRNAQG